jgi:enoyl-CoA hydratase/carnithine racemase
VAIAQRVVEPSEGWLKAEGEGLNSFTPALAVGGGAMNAFQGKTLSWRLLDGVIEVALHREPCNEIGSTTLEEMEQLVGLLEERDSAARALIFYSRIPAGFSAGADLRELYRRVQGLTASQRTAGIREFLERIHRVFNLIDAASLVTVAATHGVVFGGGFELALTCDMIVADRTARFCFPELRLGLIPGFGGIPRLKRDLGNGLIRDLLLTGRSINAAKAAGVGLVSQLVGEGQALRTARSIAAQACKFDPKATGVAKGFIKSVPYDELQQEISLFCDLFDRPAVDAALRKFVESGDAQPYLP